MQLAKPKLTFQDKVDIVKQLKRYASECGEVVVTRVDPAVFKQAPVAHVTQS